MKSVKKNWLKVQHNKTNFWTKAVLLEFIIEVTGNRSYASGRDSDYTKGLIS